MKPKRLKPEDILSQYGFTPRVTSSQGTTLTESNLNKIMTQAKLAQAVRPYQTPSQQSQYAKLIQGMFEQEFPPTEEPPKDRSLQEFLDTLK